MKAVLISIRPEWCEQIAIGRKKMELRKTFPNLPIPFKCYIYQTKQKWIYRWAERLGLFKLADVLPQGQGKVIGEFTCFAKLGHCEMANADLAERASCVRRETIHEYANGKEVFGLGICDLKIYDRPKPLNKFVVYCDRCDKRPIACKFAYEENNENGYYSECMCDFKRPIERPPQSWCYVEELTDNA